MKTQKSLLHTPIDGQLLWGITYGFLALGWLDVYLKWGLSIQTPPSDNLLWLVSFGAAVVPLVGRTPTKEPMQGAVLVFLTLADIARFWVVTLGMYQYLQWVLSGGASPLIPQKMHIGDGAYMVAFGISILFNLGFFALLSLFERKSP